MQFTGIRLARLRRLGAVVAVTFGVLGLAACEPGARLDLYVNSTTDLVDAAPGDGVCEATPGGDDCTVRAAVMEANATPLETSVHIILEPGSTHVLTRSATCSEGSATDATIEDLDIERDLTLSGNGATIRTQGHEIFHPEYGSLTCAVRAIQHHSGQLILEDLTLRGDEFDTGAALLNHAQAQLTNVSATGSAFGGGVVIHNTGDLTLVRSRITGGTGLGLPGSARPWAAIHSVAGSLVLLDTTVANNAGVTRYGSGDFAGIRVVSGQATIIQSRITGHRGYVVGPVGVTVNGYGIRSQVPVKIIRSTVVDNGVGRDVGGTGTAEVSGSILGSCTQPVVSLGWSSDSDGSCLGAGQPTDLVSTPTAFQTIPAADYVPATGSAVLDAIPVGTEGLCDGSWPTDLRGLPRLAGDGCEIGAIERQPSDG